MRRMEMFALCLCVFGATACNRTMTQSDYYQLAEQVSDANYRSFQNALAEIEQRGMVLAPELERWVSPGRQAQELCMAMERSPYLRNVEMPEELPERVVVRVGEIGREGVAAPPPVEVSAPLDLTCDFFMGTRNKLEVEFADNISQSLVRTLVRIEQGRLVARNADGHMVLIELHSQPASFRRVVVEQECNGMPSSEPHPLEHGHAIRKVFWAPNYPVETVDMKYEVNELDVVCTDYVY